VRRLGLLTLVLAALLLLPATAQAATSVTGGWNIDNGYTCTVTWDAGAHDHYHLYQGETLVYDGPGTTYTDTHLTPSTTYTYYCYSVDGATGGIGYPGR